MNDREKRYAPGGDIYDQLAAEYGPAGADRVYRTLIQDGFQAIPAVLGELRSGPSTGSSSTVVNLVNQLISDPLAAPIESANHQLGKVAGHLFKSPWLLAVLVMGGIGLALYAANSLGFLRRFTK